MAAGDVKIAFGASSNLTVTNLASIATSADWTAGWTSATVDNSSNLYSDYLLTVKITAGTTLTAGQIQVRIYAELDDTNYPDIFSAGTEGTEGTATIHDTATRDNSLVLAKVLTTDTTNSQVYCAGPISVASLFGGVCPRKFCVFISHSTAANLAASGHQVTVKGVYYNVASA